MNNRVTYNRLSSCYLRESTLQIKQKKLLHKYILHNVPLALAANLCGVFNPMFFRVPHFSEVDALSVKIVFFVQMLVTDFGVIMATVRTAMLTGATE